MTAPNTRQVVEDLQAAGLCLTLTPDRALSVAPAGDLTPTLRDLIRTHKVELVAWLTAANDSTAKAVAPIAFVGPPPDPDRWCWPHSDAMTGAEIDRFTGRLVQFTAKGLSPNDAEVLADKLLVRDRDGDDRRVCLECAYLSGWAGRRQCRGLQYAGMGGPLASAGQVAMLQRCNGFKGAAS